MTAAEQEGRADGRLVRFVLPRPALRGRAGQRLGARAGESLEFQDYRDYTPGDDLRNLDWNVLARTGREVVRVRREEIAPVIEVFRDRSASMSVPPSKSDCADWLFGLLSSAARGCRVVERERPATSRAVRVVVSDLMIDEDPDARLVRLAHNAASVVVLRVLAREEADPPSGGVFELADSETGERREMSMDPETRSRYLSALAAHTARWTDAVRRVVGAFADIAAESPRPDRIAALAAAGLLEAVS